jgi:D-amino-acid dehydrogenase
MTEGLRDAIVVVGAGIVGVCTAWQLLRRGADVTLLDRDEPGVGCSYGNAGALSCGSVAPLAMPGLMRDALSMLLDPAAPLRIPLSYLPKAAPWLLRFVRASRPDEVRRISGALSTLLANSIEKHMEMLGEVGASDVLRRTGQLYLYPDEKWLAKDTMSWALRREHGLAVERVSRANILALEPEVGPDYSIGMFTPEQGMSINPYRQVTAIAGDFARRGGRVVRDRVAGIEVAADRVRAVRGENAAYTCDHAVLCAGAWSAQLLEGLGYALPLESQRGYHVTIPSPGVSVARPVIAARAVLNASAQGQFSGSRRRCRRPLRTSRPGMVNIARRRVATVALCRLSPVSRPTAWARLWAITSILVCWASMPV